MLIKRKRNGAARVHCDRCDIGAQRSGSDEPEALQLAEGEGFQQWKSTSDTSRWHWLCPWCVWEVGLPEEAHDIIQRMLETLAMKGVPA